MNPSPVLDFTAIDFETANGDSASVCQVGLVRVKDGKLVATDSWLVIPPTGADSFNGANIGVHGIRPEDVQEKGIDWRQSLGRLEDFRDGSILVAHNANFDRRVFEAACHSVGVIPAPLRWEDTLSLARRHLELPNHKLATVAAHVGVPNFTHHDAASDAEACARIALYIAEKIGARDAESLWAKPRASKSTVDPRFYDRASKTKVSDLPRPAEDADERHPLHGQKVVLTGELGSMSRWQAFEAIAAAGATPQKGVTLKTTMLVVAEHERIPSDYDPSAGTSKERKASEYIQRGNAISFVGARDFQEALNWQFEGIDETPAVLESDYSFKSQPQVEPTPVEKTPEPDILASSPPAQVEKSVKPTFTHSSCEPALKQDPVSSRKPVLPRESAVPPEPVATLRTGRSTPAAAPLTNQQAPVSAPTSVYEHSAQRPEGASASRATTASGAGSEVPQRHQPMARIITGWFLLIPGALITLFMLVVTVTVVVEPGPLTIRIAAGLFLLLIALVPGALAFWGIYLIWLRDRWRSRRKNAGDKA